MAIVTLNSTSVLKGQTIELRLEHKRCSEFSQLQVEIFDCGVLNPSSKLGFGREPNIMSPNVCAIDVDTQHLSSGLYEIKYLRLHNGDADHIYLDIVGGREYDRTFLEIVENSDDIRKPDAIRKEVSLREQEIERQFMIPVDARIDSSVPSSKHTVFVFIRDVLLGTPIRFDRFQVFSTRDGIPARDSHDAINSFLARMTRTNIEFAYNQEIDIQSRRASPVCVVHFPAIEANSMEDAREFCLEQAKAVVLALALARDAGGSIFDVVVIDQSTGQSRKFTNQVSYVGNLLTGSLAGESASVITNSVNEILGDPMSAFLTEQYKDARREQNEEFQYIRFWQILELMADQENFDPKELLVGFNGEEIKNDSDQHLTSKGSVNIVFRLFKEAGIGSTEQTWRNVNVWFACRSAVAHYGALSEYQRLDRPKVREWALVAVKAREENNGQDMYLNSLRWMTRLLIMKRLAPRSDKA
ncbi:MULTISPECIES: hypothetical protein [Pseudidiomarina]|uniref:Uncharacterized protein n=2 Tax=Pseudidiomarina TaxID=2800384 RepID=A0A368UUL9_9GAMM|nr:MULTISPECIES: hypothetical protein [Pseudidiomarina]PWW08878.1 hypothetical protein DET45_12224 [Pseudidiomarina maritima]RBP90146.1 hypothetical protein DFO81_1089 [Pseudidiomarina tainanensis]RCW31740.1 hypothetical protein DFO79_10889 [Pseudidiomarina tainanensis]